LEIFNGKGFMQVGNYYSVRPQPLLIENMLMTLSTKADSYSSAGTEAGICNKLMIHGQAQLA
jgi:hypothetical protein